jgi:hypothetical protein
VGLAWVGLGYWKGQRFSSSLHLPDQLWDPSSLVGHGYQELKVRWPGHVADHSPVSSADVKNEWNYTSSSPCAFSGCTGTTLPLLLIVRSVVFYWNVQQGVQKSMLTSDKVMGGQGAV